MLIAFAVVLVALLCVAAYVVWRVVRDFFSALEAEYDFQLSRDPEYKKRRRVRRKPLRQRALRVVRRSIFRIKRPLYLLAVSLGVKR